MVKFTNNYIQYSTIAARAVRQALKGEAKDSGVKRNCQHQVPEVGSRQASRKEGISVNVKDQTNVLK